MTSSMLLRNVFVWNFVLDFTIKSGEELFSMWILTANALPLEFGGKRMTGRTLKWLVTAFCTVFTFEMCKIIM